MHVVSDHPTVDVSGDRIEPSLQRVEDTVADATSRATMRSARALVLGFDRGEISDALLVRELRIKAFRFFLIDPLQRALRHAMSRFHR